MPKERRLAPGVARRAKTGLGKQLRERFHHCARGGASMKYVYILESLDSRQFYVGITDDLRARLTKHNAGEVPHTSKYGPWRIKTYVAFSDEAQGARIREISEVRLRPGLRQKAPLIGSPTPPTPHSAVTQRDQISSFIADNSATEHADAARIPCGTARAFSRSAWPCGVSAISTCRSSSRAARALDRAAPPPAA